jgi:hypothetical protein
VSRRARFRFWAEVVLAALSGALFLLTLVWQDWIEAVFGTDPDHGDGSAEWLIVAVTLVAAIGFSVASWLEWRRGLARSVATAPGPRREA